MRYPTLRRRLLAGFAVSVLGGPLILNPVLAAPPNPAQDQVQVIDFNIQPGSLDAALLAFAAQSGRQLFYTPDLVAGLRSPGLKGRLTPEEAIDRLLAGAPVQVNRSNPNTFVLKRRVTPATFAAPAADSFPQQGPEPAPATSDLTELSAIIVTGSLIRGAANGASPVVTISREDLDRSGRATVADMLTDLPQAFGGRSAPDATLANTDSSGSNAAVATGVNLRGLGPSATLVLVNGRRMAGAGLKGDFADVSALPAAAVDRVEILLDGASALYGSDAVGGVVNVILRKDFDGAETRARVGVAQGGGAAERQLAQTVGTTWRGGHALLAYEHYERGALASADRAYTANADLRSLGGTDRRLTYSHPGNVLLLDVAAGTYVPTWAIPAGQSGTVGTGDGAQFDPAVVGLQGLDQFGAMSEQAVLQVDARQRCGQVAQIAGRGAD